MKVDVDKLQSTAQSFGVRFKDSFVITFQLHANFHGAGWWKAGGAVLWCRFRQAEVLGFQICKERLNWSSQLIHSVGKSPQQFFFFFAAVNALTMQGLL